MNYLYQEILMDHYHYPRNNHLLESPDFDSGNINPSCGDKIRLQGKIEAEKLVKLGFEGSGCVISLAAASLLTEAVMQKELSEIMLLDAQFMLGLLKISLGPTRLRCALLCLLALQEGVNSYYKKEG